MVMEKGDTDLSGVIRNRSSQNSLSPTLIRFYWQEMLEAVGSIHEKSRLQSQKLTILGLIIIIIILRCDPLRFETGQFFAGQWRFKVDRFRNRQFNSV